MFNRISIGFYCFSDIILVVKYDSLGVNIGLQWGF